MFHAGERPGALVSGAEETAKARGRPNRGISLPAAAGLALPRGWGRLYSVSPLLSMTFWYQWNESFLYRFPLPVPSSFRST